MIKKGVSMDSLKCKAKELLNGFRGGKYVYGIGAFEQFGREASGLGKRFSIVMDGWGHEWMLPIISRLRNDLEGYGLQLAGACIRGARSNAPRQDVFRILEELKAQHPDAVISLGGGSTTDAVKAAIAMYCLEDIYPNIDDYFGEGKVSLMLQETKRVKLPHFAVMTGASSAAHLTKYSNITDMETGQKLLMVDNALVPTKSMFDYSCTITQPWTLSVDGALDGISHCLEVLMGISDTLYDKVEQICLTGIELIVNNIKTIKMAPTNIDAREAVGLGTDLGGYAIMVGGTNGAHLNSFSMIDILSHGRACALMNPYYVVLFSTAVAPRLKKVARIYKNSGYIEEDIECITGHELGIVLANGMIRLSKDLGFPVTLKEVAGYTETYKMKCLEAARDPKLESKLKNMPIPMTLADVDLYMKAVLDAAESGDMSMIQKVYANYR